MLSPTESASQLMLTLMKATGSYVCSRIYEKKYKAIYIEALKKCIALIESNPENFDEYKFEIEQRLNYEAFEHKATFWNSQKRDREYALLAVNQALEIINNLHARFVTGTSDAEPRNFKNRALFVYTDEGHFQ